MKEINDIIRSFHQAQQQGIRTALATVVKVEGSSYRQAGARMLVTETGQFTGAISGGCLEGDALRRALLAIDQQQNKLVTYDTSNEDDIEFGIQLGCNGIVHILFEPINPANANNPIVLLEQLLKQREKTVIVTFFSLNRMQHQEGTTMLFREHDELLLPDPVNVLKQEIAEVFENEKSIVRQLTFNEQTVEALIAFIPPPVKLVIAGAGNDVQPLVAIASLLGWQTVVADGRKSHATLKRFPQAGEVLTVKPGPLAETISPDCYTVLLLMTHNYNYDLELLKLMINKELVYIGILGPKKKFERMVADLFEREVMITAEQTDRIFAPVGHDIGAETPEEIAVSIIAEIKAVLSGRKGASLKFKERQIHAQ